MAYQGIGSALLGVLPEGVKLVRVDTRTDPNVIRKDWTLSFVPGIDRWVSFHSYSPWAMAASRTRLLSAYGVRVFEHGKNNPGFFYGAIQSSYVDAHIAPKTGKTYLLQSLQWTSEVRTTTHEVRTATFSKVTVYDSYQVSKPTQATAINTKRAETVWRFNSFRDIALPNTAIKLDRVLNPLAVDEDRHWQKQGRFIDNWFAVRLETDNSAGNTLYLHDITPIYRESFR